MKITRRGVGSVLVGFALAVAGCEDSTSKPAPGGIPNVSNTPTSMFGKAVKAGKDTKQALGEGGNSREAAVLNAKIKLEQIGETITAMKARLASRESARKAVEEADLKHRRATELAAKMESSTAADDGSEVKTLRGAMAELESAVEKARGMF